MDRYVFELAAEVQELRRATKRLAGALMWHLGERIPERITEQTVHLPAPPHISDVSPSKRTVVSTSIAVTTKLAEIPQTLCIDTDVDTPAVMQRQVPQIQTLSTTVEALLNQTTKHVEVLQTQYIDKVATVPIVIQRRVPRPSLNQATKPVKIPQLQHIDEVAAMPVVTQRQVPRIQTVLETVKVPPAQFVGTVVNVPVIIQIMTLVAPQVPQFQTLPKTGKVPQVQLGSVCTHRSSMCQCLKK